jgi:hypothetical protein
VSALHRRALEAGITAACQAVEGQFFHVIEYLDGAIPWMLRSRAGSGFFQEVIAERSSMNYFSAA